MQPPRLPHLRAVRLCAFALLTLAASVALGQNRSSYTVILPEVKPLGIKSFYIKSVEDQRLDKSAIGTAQIGMNNRRVPAVLEYPIEMTFLTYALQGFGRPAPQARPLVLRVQEIAVDEVTTMASERGSARVAISLATPDSAGVPGRVVGTAEATAEAGGLDVSGKLGRLLTEALSKALRQIDAGDWESVAAGAAFIPDEDTPTFTRTVLLPEGEHLYSSLSDFARRKPSDKPYRLARPAQRTPARGTRSRSNATGSSPRSAAEVLIVKRPQGGGRAPDAAVLVRDGEVYVASHLYNGGMSTRGHLRRAPLVGRYIYLEDRWSSAAAGAAFGLVGALASIKTHGIVLDPMSGEITLLTPALTAELAGEHEDLRKAALALGPKDVEGMGEIIAALNERYATRGK